MSKYDLNVNGVMKSIAELSYEDLVWLFNDYIGKNGIVPTQKQCIVKNNLPHGRAINKILIENNVSYNDFLNQFGKVKHVRTESKDYDFYLERYKNVSNEIGHALTIKELKNNPYGLPSASWFVKYCPNKNVNSFNDFIIWSGYNSNKLKCDDEEVQNKLIELQSILRRPITRYDINKKTIGFSMIVINRIWGSLGKCKEELGLLKTKSSRPKPFLYYKQILDKYIDDNDVRQRGFVTWNDIEKNTEVNHKTFIKAFCDNGYDFYKYLASNNIRLSDNSFGHNTILPSGEKTVSSFEYEFSNFLEKNGFHYNKDYKRDVVYRSFIPLDNKSKINCDYVFSDKYIEIAGLISNKNNDWDTCIYNYKKHYDYQQKMIYKRKLLEENNKDYLFLFPEDFQNNIYKEKFYEFIGRR